MKYNDLPDKCKTCMHLKVWGLDMGGNHLVSCKKRQLNFYTECDKYEVDQEDKE